jgi:hypothetical protein
MEFPCLFQHELTMRPTLERCNVIKVCDYFLSAGFSPFHKYASIGCPVSCDLFVKF